MYQLKMQIITWLVPFNELQDETQEPVYQLHISV